MRLCKYCKQPIADEDIWNPDNDGNGYHHECLVDMEFKARDKQIYDKGKMDMLNKIRAEISENIEAFRMSDWETNNILADGLQMALNIIDGYREGEQDETDN